MSDLRIRRADNSTDDVNAIFDTLSAMIDESPMCKLDPWLAVSEIGRVCAYEHAWMVHDGDALVATMGLARAEFWYSAEPIIATRWLYARPAWRGNRKAWTLLEGEARTLADQTRRMVLLDIHNPARPSRRAAIVSRTVKVLPSGVRLRLLPKEAA